MKIYKLAATNEYTWNLMIDTGKQDPTAGLGHAQTVVLDLADGLLECHRTVVVADNFLTSISLAESLLRNDTYLIGNIEKQSCWIGTWSC